MQLQAGNNDEQRGFANARNAKLHHMAKQKRVSKGGQAARLSNHHKPVLLSSVLAQTPQMFDSFKVKLLLNTSNSEITEIIPLMHGVVCCKLHAPHTPIYTALQQFAASRTMLGAGLQPLQQLLQTSKRRILSINQQQRQPALVPSVCSQQLLCTRRTSSPTHDFLRICHHPQVACVERYLTQIDELPEQYRSAEVVYLSRNSLRSLAGIQQFPCLRVLSASDNLLEDIEQLRVLEACPNLQVMRG
jgi:Leucine-rich repeat (LRR) protein